MTTLYYPMSHLNTTGEELVTIEIMGCQKGSIFFARCGNIAPWGHKVAHFLFCDITQTCCFFLTFYSKD